MEQIPVTDYIQHKYGMALPYNASPFELELIAFRSNWPTEKGGLGRYSHLRNAVNLILPDDMKHPYWHPWRDKRFFALSEYDVIGWAGCASSGKTHDAALYAHMWWLCDPWHSSVIMTSTTRDALKRRLWPPVKEYFHKIDKIAAYPGVLIDSKTQIIAENEGQRHDKSGIIAIAVKDGSSSKAAADIQGWHNKRILVIVDEATDTPPAIFDAIVNLYSGCDDFQMIVIGNPDSQYDEHGKICEPRSGWGSVSVEDEEWETITQITGKPGICQHFDALKSPNWLESEQGKSDPYKFLVGTKHINNVIKKYGEGDPRFWKYYRGYWAPDGVSTTVFNETMIEQNNGRGAHTFVSESHMIAGLDPGFGGDRCVFRPAKCGNLENGLFGIQLLPPETIKIDIKNKNNPVNYQIAHAVKKKCEDLGIQPNHLAVDVTAGSGGGLSDIMAREWSNRIIRIEFGGVASEQPITREDERVFHLERILEMKIVE